MSQSVPQLPAGLRVGDLISGKYRVEFIIGGGAMGTVVAARHLVLGTRVAIKFLKPDRVADHPEAKARFIREAQAASRVSNEHVARVMDIASLDSGDLYIVMEYLDGCDLAEWIERHGPMPVEDAVDCVLQACEAIAEAHVRGIVHRDLKPANLYLVRRDDGMRGLVKVLDFGISKTTGMVPATVDLMAGGGQGGAETGGSAMMGSPYYMSPEQMESARDVDGRSDIWALGVILCQLITGTLPFSGPTLLAVYAKMIAAEPTLPAFPPGTPAGIDAIIRKCIQRKPEGRYATAKELAVALKPFAPSRRGSVGSIRPEPVPATKPAGSGLPAVPTDTLNDGTLPSRQYVVHSPPPAAPLSERTGLLTGPRRWGVFLGVGAVPVVLVAAVILGRRSDSLDVEKPAAVGDPGTAASSNLDSHPTAAPPIGLAPAPAPIGDNELSGEIDAPVESVAMPQTHSAPRPRAAKAAEIPSARPAPVPPSPQGNVAASTSIQPAAPREPPPSPSFGSNEADLLRERK
jgi:serine/threonine-protein kinase